MDNNNLLVIVGPTSIGKSQFAIDIAQKHSGEIINGDSRQIYKLLNIGTSKPNKTDQSIIKHHLIDIKYPDEEYNLSMFLHDCKKSIKKIQTSSKLPILVGGSGQYIWALLENWKPPNIKPDQKLRSQLLQESIEYGTKYLHNKLFKLNTASANKIDQRNTRRIIRAIEIEIYKDLTNRTPDIPNNNIINIEKFNILIIGLTVNRKTLYEKIDLRVDKMIESGWIDETKNILSKGYNPKIASLSSLGYSEIISYLNGVGDLPEAINQTKFRTHKFARRQYTWFKKSDKRIKWFDTETELIYAKEYINKWI
ncbi:MAG: tRNA (adenosine(37)-N6)-dimethylallyltransferase MiaA [Chloroflexi bacterium]|nr:tRNA (adenosine(37)-N6)-dimethylallyltransferase MiaA [Chloroflexota bacterium]|tara:strand:+ start:3726 stop:4655 length:930 start_codon:yes stop_codon:yes gene_type:complete